MSPHKLRWPAHIPPSPSLALQHHTYPPQVTGGLLGIGISAFSCPVACSLLTAGKWCKRAAAIFFTVQGFYSVFKMSNSDSTPCKNECKSSASFDFYCLFSKHHFTLECVCCCSVIPCDDFKWTEWLVGCPGDHWATWVKSKSLTCLGKGDSEGWSITKMFTWSFPLYKD